MATVPVQPDPAGLFNFWCYDGARSTPGWEQFANDTMAEATATVDLDEHYIPHAIQQAYHESPTKHRLLGGAAGPGKTLALIIDHLVTSNQFEDPVEAAQVHTLLLRRTYPQLEGSLIPRFLEKVPRSLYRRFVGAGGAATCTWLNGAQTHFGNMQHEQDVWKYQGTQNLLVDFDELTQFTFYQWTTIGAWNRCPVSPFARKGGATNPVGISAAEFACLFGADGKGQRPSPSMDTAQRLAFRPEDYEYFPCTYRDNPIYANDPIFLSNLEAYPGPIRDALKLGLWGALGTYFDIWDPAVHVYDDKEKQPEPWWPKWISGDWGFEHDSAIYWHCMDPAGVCRTYRELVVNHHEPNELAEAICKCSFDEQGQPETYEPYGYFSHDAFAQKYSRHPIGEQMNEILRKKIGVQLVNASRDKKGREQLMYSMLRQRVRTGEYVNLETGEKVPILVPKWQIAQSCTRLAAVMPMAPRAGGPADPAGDVETIADFLGDDPIDGAGHGIYGKFSGKIKMPDEMRIAAKVTSEDPTVRYIQSMKAELEIKKENKGAIIRPRWKTPRVH